LGFIRRLTRRNFLRAASAAGSALALPSLSAAESVVRRYPSLHKVGPDCASVVWSMNTKTNATLMWSGGGTSSSILPRITELTPAQTGLPATVYQYEAAVNGLVPGVSYAYDVQTGAADAMAPLSAPRAGFRTPGPGPFSFLHIADCGSGEPPQLQIASRMATEENIALVLANGDLSYPDGAFGDLESKYYGAYRDLMARMPFFPVAGNHEYFSNSGNPYFAMFCGPEAEGAPASERGRYYSFDWGEAHFIALDSNDPLTAAAAGNGGMLRWLEEDLRRTRKFWKIVFFHHPPYAVGKHHDEPEAALVRAHIVPILERYGVHLVLSGHEHNYQRTAPLMGGSPDSGGITYVAAGGGGAELYPPGENGNTACRACVHHYVRVDVGTGALTVRAIAGDGSGEFDRHRIAPVPRIGTVTNAASYTTDLAAGGMASIFGRNLSAVETRQTDPSEPVLSTAALRVTLELQPVPMTFAGAGQINVQLPFDFAGPGTLTVTTPNGSASQRIAVASAAPAIFQGDSGIPLATHGDGTAVTKEKPARAGETIAIYLTGLGQVRGAVRCGAAAVEPLAVIAAVEVVAGGRRVSPTAAELLPGVVGAYVVRFAIPSNLHAPLALIHLEAEGHSSLAVELPIE
jgi:uncharacterized protein (TIGR03437 family)